jgi:hypothetical protein
MKKRNAMVQWNEENETLKLFLNQWNEENEE